MFSQDQIRLYLEQTLQLAAAALEQGNYPIGAVFVDDSGVVQATAMNECTTHDDITAHAEILGIRTLANMANKDNESKLTLFTSLEPCYGCSFFLARTNITHIYSALTDPHKGGILSLQQQPQFEKFFKNIAIENDLFDDLKQKSKELMKSYFLKQGREDAAAFYGHVSRVLE